MTSDLNEFDRRAAWLVLPDDLDPERAGAISSALADLLGDTPLVSLVPAAEGDPEGRRGLPAILVPIGIHIAKKGIDIIAGEIKQQLKDDHEAKQWYDQRAKDYLERNRI